MEQDAKQVHASAGPGRDVIGWKLDREQRKELLQQFPPRFAKVVADHVTLKAGVSSDAALPCEKEGEIIGRADDGAGVEAMIVRISGTSDRPDGSIYHITWSLGTGRRAVESNSMLRAAEWARFDLPMPILLEPARFR